MAAHPISAELFAALARRALVLGLTLALLAAWAPARASADGPIPDFGIANGHYYSQPAGGDPAHGYTVTDEGGIQFWTAFQRLGGVSAAGYPVTRRFTWMGFVDQAMQKLIFQWNPAQQSVQIVNTFDVMEQLGLDGQLQARYQTPPSADNAADAGKSWAAIVARHQAELEQVPAIKAAYFADPDPIAHFGLPQAYADAGAVRVVRCQRAVFQQWKVDEPWARAGQVTIANGGDIAKALGVLPADAGAPTAAAGLIVGPFNATLALSPAQEQAVRAAADTLRPSLVEVAIQTGPNTFSGGTGMVLDANGDILTDAHVVKRATQATVQLADGRVLPAQVVGRDAVADVAVLHVGASSLPAVAFGNAAALPRGALLVSLGFAPTFPNPPALRAGTLLALAPGNASGVHRLVASVADVFGDSGAPVVNLRGQVVGEVIAVHFDGATPVYSVDNAFEDLQPIAQQIIAKQGDVGLAAGARVQAQRNR